MRSVILTAGARLLVALLLVFSVFMLLRGHNVPGGGFIGELIGAVGFVVYAIARHIMTAQQHKHRKHQEECHQQACTGCQDNASHFASSFGPFKIAQAAIPATATTAISPNVSSARKSTKMTFTMFRP